MVTLVLVCTRPLREKNGKNVPRKSISYNLYNAVNVSVSDLILIWLGDVI